MRDASMICLILEHQTIPMLENKKCFVLENKLLNIREFQEHRLAHELIHACWTVFLV